MPPNIMIRVGADTDAATRELGKLSGPIDDVSSRGQKMGSAVRGAALPAVAVLGALAFAAKGAAEAAAEDEAAQVKLAGALERTAGATAAQVAAAEAYISKLSLQTGIADDELRPALAKLASATGDVGKAQDQLQLALDIAAQSGKSLAVVSKSLAAADDGHTAALSKLVPGLDAATLKSKDMAAITADLASKVGGAAAEAAGTATGKYKIMQVQMGELQEKIGTALIPVITALSAVMLRATTFASEHTTAVKIVIAAIAALAAGILLVNVALKAYEVIQIAVKAATVIWTGVQWLLNAALDANPVGIVVVAIAALAVGIAVAYRKSETFRDAIGLLWKILGFTNPVAAIIQHFDDLQAVIERVVGWISRIHFPSPPSWVGKLNPFGLAAPGSAPALVARSLGPHRASGSAGPRSAAGGGLLSLGAAGVTVNVYGATDPEGTARAIKRTLRGLERRQGAMFAVEAPA